MRLKYRKQEKGTSETFETAFPAIWGELRGLSYLQGVLDVRVLGGFSWVRDRKEE
jgi:hypothetical protein